jgi:hypothetical protein
MRSAGEQTKQDSVKSAIGLLYQRREAGAALIRVLERYARTGCQPLSGRHGSPRTPRRSERLATLNASVQQRQQKLEQLYMRRAVVDELIRSIEAYTELTHSITGKRAGPQSNH